VDDHGVHGEMRNDAMNVAATALDTNPEEKDISKHIKVCLFLFSFDSSPHIWSSLGQTYFDQKYGPTWHCIVGSDFRAFVTHESKHFIFFYIGKTAICLYKAG
jgi:dynein light chain LC8-type